VRSYESSVVKPKTPVMTLSRNTFFLLLFIVSVSPFVIWKLIWLSRTDTTVGKVWYMGHTLELHGDISSHLVILFFAGKDSITFNTPGDLPFKIGDPVPVRYVRDNPSDAVYNTALSIWGNTGALAIWPILVLLVLYFIPKSMDPLIPRKSKVRLSRRKIIEIVQ
jgi:hypothetical protein